MQLFETYPDAYRKDDEALRNFFTSRTSVGEATVALIVRTFKVLCEASDFEAAPSPTIVSAGTDSAVTVPVLAGATAVSAGGGITLNLNIQITLPETKDASIYDAIFESLKKHLMT